MELEDLVKRVDELEKQAQAGIDLAQARVHSWWDKIDDKLYSIAGHLKNVGIASVSLAGAWALLKYIFGG